MSQYIINTGNIANDGQGDPLRTAFTDTNLNFNQIWAAGPVNSNIKIANNTIITTNTNGNLILATNGIGAIVTAQSVVPDLSNVRMVGAPNNRFNTVYSQYLDISGIVTAGNLSVSGNLYVAGNTVTVNQSNLDVSNTLITLAANATIPVQADGGGIFVAGANASLTYSSSLNSWVANIALSVQGNVSADYFVGDGSGLSNLNVSVDANTLTGNRLNSGVVFSNLTTVGTLTSLTVDGNVLAGNITATFYGDGSHLSNLGNVANAVYATFAGTAATANLAAQAVTAINADTALYAVNANTANTANFALTSNCAIYANTATTAILANSAIVANVALFAESVGVLANLSVTGNIVTGGILTNNYYYANGAPFAGGGSGSIIQSPTAPLNPTASTLWWDEVSGRLYVYYNDGVSSQWVDAAPAGTGGGGSASLVQSPTPPTNPTANTLWWDEVSGRLYVYYNDGTSSQWVDASPAGTGGGGSTGNITFNSTTISTNLANTDIAIQGNGTGAINIVTGANSYTQLQNDSFANGSSYVYLQDGSVYVYTDGGEWTFDNTGNLTLPGGTPSINYANGQPYGGSGGGATDWANIGNISNANGPTSIAVGQNAGGVSAGLPARLRNVVWGGTEYVAVGATNNTPYVVLFTSPDGVAWTQQAVGQFQGTLYGVTWSSSQSQYVAVGYDDANSGSLIITSPDGVTWTQHAIGAYAGTLYGINWNGGYYVAVGSYNNYPIIIWSTNGITWTLGASVPGLNPGNPVAITWANNQYVVVGTDASNNALIYTAPDVDNWTQQATGVYTNARLTGVTFGGSNYVAVGNTGSIYDSFILTSPDGITWTQQAAGLLPRINFSCINWNGSQFLAIGYDLVGNQQAICTSPDGVAWTQQSTSLVLLELLGVTWHGSQYVVVGDNYSTSYAAILTSPDGVTWTQQSVGQIGQGTGTVALGLNAAESAQGNSAVSIGNQAGRLYQGAQSIAIGLYAGENNQGVNSIAIGTNAGAGFTNPQADHTIILNATTTEIDGVANQTDSFYVAPVRNDTGNTVNALYYNTDTFEISYGPAGAGGATDWANIGNISNTSGPTSVIIGQRAGENNQGNDFIALGLLAGYSAIGNNAVAIGSYAQGHGTNSIAIGLFAGGFGANSIAIGASAGQNTQGDNAIAIGQNAGNTTQGYRSVAVGIDSGKTNQGASAIAVGDTSGYTGQGVWSVAIGTGAGQNNQGFSALSIGYSAGQVGQGNHAVAIGSQAGNYNQPANTIIINATGLAVDGVADQTDSFYVAPVRNDTGNVTNALYYNTSTFEISYGPASGNTTWANIANINNQDGPTTIDIGQYAGQTVSQIPGSLVGIIWGEKYVAVGYDGINPIIATSPDGGTWTLQDAGLNQVILTAVTWSGAQYVAVGVDNNSNQIILTSPDGVTWTQQTGPGLGNLSGITWSADQSQYVAVGELGGYAVIITSPDGITWTQQAIDQYGLGLYNITWSGAPNNQYVAVGYNYSGPSGTLILTSPDGVTWTEQVVGIGGSELYGIAWDGYRYVAVGYNYTDPYRDTSTILTSPDGITWTQQAIGQYPPYLISITWSNTRGFVAVGPDSYVNRKVRILTSPDGATWTQQAAGQYLGDPRSIACMGGLNYFTITGNYLAGEALILTSDDSINWTQQALQAPGANSIAIGSNTGGGQGTNSVAIGASAGSIFQGANAVAIGANAGANAQGNNSIILNATGNILDQQIDNTFTVAPVRNDTSNVTNALYYNTATFEISYGPAGSNSIINGLHSLTIENDGSLLAANNGSATNYVINNNTPDVDLRNSSGTGSFTAGASNYTIRVAGTPNWVYDSSGALTLPLTSAIFEEPSSNWRYGLNIVGPTDNSAVRIYNYGSDGKGFGASAVYINNTNVEIITNNQRSGGPGETWTFDNTGNLTLPGAINTNLIVGDSAVGQVVIIANSAVSSDYWEFRTHPSGAPDGSITSALHVPPSDGANISAIHFPGYYGGGYLGWYNVNSWANSLTLISTNTVSITTEAQGGIPGETQWLFDTVGNLTLPALTGTPQTISLTSGGVGYTTADNVPTDSGPYGNGHGMTLNIVADTGNSNAVLSVTINTPGQGYHNGAVITIAQPSSTGTATVTVDAVGNGVPSINYANGQPYGSSGGSANIIYNGLSNVSIPTANGNVTITTNTQPPWIFGTDGVLTLPAGGIIKNQVLVDVVLQPYTQYPQDGVYYTDIGLPYLSNLWTPGLAVVLNMVNPTGDWTALNGGTFYISHVGGELVSLCTDLGLTTPINVTIGTYDSGTLISLASDSRPYISIQPSNSTLWTFGTDGELTTPQGGRLGVAGKGWTGLDGGNGAPVSVTSYYANGFYAGCFSAYPDGNVSVSTYTGSSNYTWNFDNTGALNLPVIGSGPFGGFSGVIQTASAYPTLLAYGLGGHGGPELDWTNSDDPANTFSNSNTVRNTLYLNGQAGLYVGFNENGNTGPYTGHFQVDTLGNVQIPSQNVGNSTPNGTPGEATYLRGTRKIINGVYTGAQNPFAVELAAGPASTVVYTATNQSVKSVRVTFAVQSTGNGSCWEQFDVVATPSQDIPGTVNYVVSNRIKSTSTVTDTQVTATLNGANQIEISLVPMTGQNGWASFDAVEFGLMVD